LRNDKSIIDKDTKAKATFNLAMAVLSCDKGPPCKHMASLAQEGAGL
jgi:hypothetical protein